MRLFNLFKLSLACVLATGMAFAQGVGASGDIKGTVTDPTGAIIANGTVTATEIEKGIKHTVTTDSEGAYRFVGLLPAAYTVSASKSGFQTETAKSVTVNIGQTMIVDFHLKVSSVSESVEVTAEPPVVETERSHQANVISEQYIRDLPINRRDYLTFTQLAPAVSDSTRLGGDQDFRVKQTPQSGLSFYGSNGRGNSVTVDGGEANDDSGGVRLNLSQEAVQEFQVNRSNYGADLGGASGASINIVSKTGTNNVHGSLFGFFRNDAMDARNPFAFTQALAPGQAFNPALPDSQGTATKDSLTREQFGGSVGFPISRDRTFLFTAFEGLVQDAQNAVPLLTNTSLLRPDKGLYTGNNQQAIINGLASLPGNPGVPCLTGQPTLPAATCATILNNILTINSVNPLSKFLVNQLESNGGLFDYPTRQYLGSARWDHHFDDHNQMYLRYSFAHDNEQSPDVQSLVGFSAGSSVHALDHTLQSAWFHQFSPKTMNEIRAQYNYTNFNVIPNQPGEVGLDIPGFAKLGTNIFLPSLTIMRRYEFADNATVIRGNHSMKFGFYELVRGNHTESHTFFPGRFVFGSLRAGNVLSPCMQLPGNCNLTVLSPTDPACNKPRGQLQTPGPGQVCGEAVINSLQAASLGLPQFYQQGFGDPTYNYPRPFTAAYWQDTWNIRPNFTLTFGARYELDSQYGALDTDNNNIAPRASFAWDPFKNHKTVVRAGYGIFYSPVYGQIADVVQTLGLVNGNRQIAQVFVPLTGAPSSAAIFQTLFAQGRVQCLTPAPGQAACITPANLTQFGINITHTGPVPPLSVVFSGQPDYQNPYSQQAEFGIEREIWGGISVSASYVYVHTVHLPVAIDTNLLPTSLTTATSPFTGQQVKFHNWVAGPFANPLLLQNNVYSSAGRAVYHGGILEIKKRFSHHMSLLANYTYSKALSDVTDFNSDFAPFDQTNLRGERGPADFDQRHKLVVAGILTSPAKNAFFSGFELAPVIRYSTGHPYNVLAGGTNINNDRHSTNDRPLGFGRNAGVGPDFMDVDLRLARRFKITERTGVQFVAEAFNLFNRTNFGSVNNEYTTFGGFANPNYAAPSPSGFFLNSAVNPPGNAQGAFTSGAGSFARRQLQLGARLTF
jgi:hypothetical protein